MAAKQVRLKTNMIIEGTHYAFGSVINESLVPEKFRTPEFVSDPAEPEPPPQFLEVDLNPSVEPVSPPPENQTPPPPKK